MGARYVSQPTSVWAAAARLREHPGSHRLRVELTRRYWTWLVHPRIRDVVTGVTFSVNTRDGDVTFSWGTPPREASYAAYNDAVERWGDWDGFVPDWADHYEVDPDNTAGGALDGFTSMTLFSLDTMAWRYPRRDIDVSWDFNAGTWSDTPSNVELYGSVWCELWAHEMLELVAKAETPRWSNRLVDGITVHARRNWGGGDTANSVEFLHKYPASTHPLWPHRAWPLDVAPTTHELTVVFADGTQYRGSDLITDI